MENQPIVKRWRIEKKNFSFNKLPDWILEKILIKLSVTDRLRCYRIDWYWNGKVWEFGWKGQKTLDYEAIFEGAERVNRELFTDESLVALFKRVGKSLIELDLYVLLFEKIPITSDICGFFHLLPNLSVIDVTGFNFSETVQFLPESLRELRSLEPTNEETFSALALKCPNLEVIDFESEFSLGGNVFVSHMNDFLLKYPGMKKLDLDCSFISGSGKLTAIGAMKELEEFLLWYNASDCFDEPALAEMIENCKGLRRLRINTECPISEEAFCELKKLPNLVQLGLDHPNVTDTVVKTLSKCPKLKSLDISWCKNLTDDAIVYLVEHCKSLVSLDVQGCPKITDKSLTAVVAEVNRRHGVPPATLPKGPSDKGIFYFDCDETGIDWENAQNVTANNPWLCVEYSPELAERSF